MTEKYTASMHEAYVKEQDAKAERERADLIERSEKASARAEYLNGGGTAAEFEKDWPAIRRERLRLRAMNAAAEGREAQRILGISRI
jgi:hypothetical protein